MATSVIQKYLLKTAAYINSDKVSKIRAGHHNYVAEREMLNSAKPIAAMSIVELERFDDEVVNRLQYLDQQ